MPLIEHTFINLPEMVLSPCSIYRKVANNLNISELNIIKYLAQIKGVNQRDIAENTGLSLGNVNRVLRLLEARGYLSEKYELTPKAKDLINKSKPRNAIILAAGFGSRMIPINFETPKALLEVHGEPLIERLIKQLNEIGVHDIHIVIGFQKEKFEYLIDRYGVNLVVNPGYARKNNLSSLALTVGHISNTYILPADLWCQDNPFNINEAYSWYMVSDALCKDSDVLAKKRHELARISKKSIGNRMIGISYITATDAPAICSQISKLSAKPENDSMFWEEALYTDGKMIPAANVVYDHSVVEINTYEQLRELDGYSYSLQSTTMQRIAQIFNVNETEITDIQMLKKGMTNKSFRFVVDNHEYIMRIPGEGTDKLINRTQEANVLNTIRGYGICDDPVYLDPSSGYKISDYIPDVRCCDPTDDKDVRECMKLLKKFHDRHFIVDHKFDIYGQIEFYESLWKKDSSAYSDYVTTKENVWKLKKYIDAQPKDWCLTHIDAVPDNFLFSGSGESERIQLTDWEYSGMQDPHVDLAMFSIYSFYSKEQVDKLLDIYFEDHCDLEVKTKIYCYIAACGLLWSNWCEYKQELGVEFGEYSLRQYRYAKEFYRYAMENIRVAKPNIEKGDGH